MSFSEPEDEQSYGKEDMLNFCYKVNVISNDKALPTSKNESLNSITHNKNEECSCNFDLEAFKSLTNTQLTNWLETLGLQSSYLEKCQEYKFCGGDLVRLGCQTFMNYLGANTNIRAKLIAKKIMLLLNSFKNTNNKNSSLNSSNASVDACNLSITSSSTTPSSPLVSPSSSTQASHETKFEIRSPMFCNNIIHTITSWKLAQETNGLQVGDNYGCKHHHRSFYDRNWVKTWLSEVVGLPQYLDAFESIVDARFLHNITLNDMIELGVKTEYHAITLRRAIQVLDAINYDLDRFISSPPAEADVKLLPLWTNRCIGEWLKSIHLSEFVVSLRGSGIHGALLALEPRFDSSLMCLLLKIPSNRTLLRRHLGLELGQVLRSDGHVIKSDIDNININRKLIINKSNTKHLKTSLLSRFKSLRVVRRSLRVKKESSKLENVPPSPQKSNSENNERYCRLSRALPSLEVAVLEGPKSHQLLPV